ncbi:MAG TPA: hypothetical protein VIK50_04415 [Gemmatimonadaceae bacterium]
MPWFFGKSKEAEQRRRAVQAYIVGASVEPDEQDVEWLASIAGDGDLDRARWELRYARRALALLVAERDALDDRTGSIVAREMRQALQMDRSVAAGMVAVAERQLNQRLTSFRTALGDRNAGDSPELRVARVLLDRVGVRDVSGNVARTSVIVRRYLEGSQEALRGAFGIASVPEDVPPSVWGSRRTS